MGYRIAPNGSLSPPFGLYQFMSHNEGTALLFESEWLLLPAFNFTPDPALPLPPLTRPLSIDSIRDITGAAKNIINQQHSTTF